MVYDVIIIGSGPAGLSAAIYAARRKMSCVVIGPAEGSQMTNAWEIENYPGIPELISGRELSKRFVAQAKKHGAEMVSDSAAEMFLKGKTKKVVTQNNKSYEGKTVIIATGAEHRALGVEGEEEHVGKGVSYCTICDAPLFKGKTVIVVGGGNSAIKAALALEKIAKKTYLAHRRDELRADEVEQEKLKKSGVEMLWSTEVRKISGQPFVREVILSDAKTGKERKLAVDGVFMEVGIAPSSSVAKAAGVRVDAEDFIPVDAKMATNVKGVFAAGDITPGHKQIIIAAGQGATAALNAYEFVKFGK